MSYYCLVGDIGGTHTRFALARCDANKITLSFLKEYLTPKGGLKLLLEEYLVHVPKQVKQVVHTACFAVAGRVKNNMAKLTNSDCVVDGNLLRSVVGCEIVVCNDFVALAAEITYLTEEQVKVVQYGKHDKDGPLLVIGAGTGLGIAQLLRANHGGRSIQPSEAGHMNVAACSHDQVDLINWLGPGAQIEDIVSGRGIETVYMFVRQHDKLPEHTDIKRYGIRASRISALRKIDPACKKVFELISSVYGSFAKNMTLDSLCTAGLFIGGGIALHNLDMFNKTFLKAFNESKTHARLLKNIPIAVITDPLAPLYGAARILQLDDSSARAIV